MAALRLVIVALVIGSFLSIPHAAFAQRHNEGRDLNDRALQLYNAGRYSDAEPLYKRSLSILEKSLGPDHPDVGSILNNLAQLYNDQGRYADAEPLFKRALAIFEKAHGPDHAEIVPALNNLASLYKNQGRYADAEPLFKRSLAIEQKALSPNHPNVAISLNNLAELYDELANYADAEPLYKRSLAILEKALGSNHPNVATALSNLADLYTQQARYADAEPLYRRSLEITEKTLGPNNPDLAIWLNNLAFLYELQSRYTDAEPLYKRSLSILEKSLGPDHRNVGQSLNNLAQLYVDQGRYTDAEPLLRRALAIDEKAIGPDHPDTALPLSNLALLYRNQGRNADAEPLLKRALAIVQKALGTDHPTVATSMNNLAQLYNDEGRYADVEPLYKRALAIREKAFGPDNPDVASSLNSLADLYRAQGRYADALPIAQRTISQNSAQKDVALDVLFVSQLQKLISPTQAFDESYDVLQRSESSAAGNAISKLAARFGAGSDDLAQLVRKDQDLTIEAEQLDKNIVAAISKPPAERNQAAQDQIRKRAEDIRSERDKLQNVFNQRFPDYVALSKPQPLSVKDTQAQLADDEALIAFDFDTKSYAWIITKASVSWVELKIEAKDLDDQVKALRAWLTSADNTPFDTLLSYKLYQETIGAIVDRIAPIKRLSIVANGALTSLPAQLLISSNPIGKKLKDQDWLVRSYTITVLPTIASLKILRATSGTSSASKPMIAFADPVFSKQAHAQARQVAMRSIANFYSGTQIDIATLGEYLPQLPGTRDEVQAIAKTLNADPNDVKLGLNATETTVKQAKLDQYRIVYFATHGLVSGDLKRFAKSKAEPSLALTIPDKPNEFDDGLLQASEIAQLKLNADWVVLSACNTAAEDEPGAEALSGLARAFFYAGARSLIVSHWEVDDKSTAQLMINTLQASTQNPKLSHAQALRQAMLMMIDGAKSDQDADPRFWAPFVVVGEPAKQQ